MIGSDEDDPASPGTTMVGTQFVPQLEFGMSEEDTLVQRIARPGKERRRGRAFLTVLSGRDVGTIHKLGPGESIIGRGHDADLQVVDEGVSRRHAKLVRDLDGTSKIVDLGSTNGTFVNGKRIQVEALREGDRIRIGASATLDFRYEYLDPPEHDQAAGSARSNPGSSSQSEASDGASSSDLQTLRDLERTLRIREDSFGVEHPAVAAMLDTIGVHLRKMGRLDDALARHERAIEIYERRMGEGPEPPELAHLLASLGETLLLGQRPQDALTVLERALAMLEMRGAEDSELAPVRFAIAKTLSAARREPLRARTLAQLARDGFASTTGGRSKTAEVEVWLDEHDW